jgi:hypothetical protein
MTTKGKNQFVVKYQDSWAVKGANNDKATRVVNTQKEAIDIGKQIARNQESELTIQGRDGKFREKNSYGHDPKNIKG